MATKPLGPELVTADSLSHAMAEPKLLVRLATATDEETARMVKNIAHGCGMTESELVRLMVGRCVALFRTGGWNTRMNPKWFLDRIHTDADQLDLFLRLLKVIHVRDVNPVRPVTADYGLLQVRY